MAKQEKNIIFPKSGVDGSGKGSISKSGLYVVYKSLIKEKNINILKNIDKICFAIIALI
ncbi:MAG: hypothetical protein LBG67_04340 [Campylobacteraceae bacterium]|nr:hypothetical protein [Campylobacteraceae bacterium]